MRPDSRRYISSYSPIHTHRVRKKHIKNIFASEYGIASQYLADLLVEIHFITYEHGHWTPNTVHVTRCIDIETIKMLNAHRQTIATARETKTRRRRKKIVVKMYRSHFRTANRMEIQSPETCRHGHRNRTNMSYELLPTMSGTTLYRMCAPATI